MSQTSDALADLIDAFARLPGIGRKSATRLAFHLIESPAEEARALARAIEKARTLIKHCAICGNLSDGERCRICADKRRANGSLCVVEEVRDIAAIERAGAFQGRYHVLGGALSPMDGIGPDELAITPLLERLKPEEIKEVILATNLSVEGDATALYLINVLRPHDVRITRIAQGLPMGADIKYADDLTLARALAARIDV